MRTDAARLVNSTGLDTHLAALRVDDTGAVRANETRFRLTLECVHDLHMHAGAFCTLSLG